MVRSILWGGESWLNPHMIFTSRFIEELGQLTENDGKVYTLEELRKHPVAAGEAQIVFGCWGTPQITPEEMRELFPKGEMFLFCGGTVQNYADMILGAGMRLFSGWGANAVPVAEYTVAQILLANKGYFQAARLVKEQDRAAAKSYSHSFPGNYRTRVGLLGAGMIGKKVISLLKSYDLEILVYDPFLPREKAEEMGVALASLEEIFSECQVISNHLANKKEIEGILNYGLFSRMKPNATFINTGRGAQVTEGDLIRAMEEEPGRTALLDVTWPEPPAKGSPLYTLPNVFLTPHIAGSQAAECERLAYYMLDDLKRLLAGETPEFEVKAEQLGRLA